MTCTLMYTAGTEGKRNAHFFFHHFHCTILSTCISIMPTRHEGIHAQSPAAKLKNFSLSRDLLTFIDQWVTRAVGSSSKLAATSCSAFLPYNAFVILMLCQYAHRKKVMKVLRASDYCQCFAPGAKSNEVMAMLTVCSWLGYPSPGVTVNSSDYLNFGSLQSTNIKSTDKLKFSVCFRTTDASASEDFSCNIIRHTGEQQRWRRHFATWCLTVLCYKSSCSAQYRGSNTTDKKKTPLRNNTTCGST